MLENVTLGGITYLAYAGVFLGVLLLFTGLASLLRRGESRMEARSRRMRMIGKGADTQQLLALFKPPESETGGRMALMSRLREMLRHAGIQVSASQFLALCGALTIAIFSVAAAMQPLPVAAAAAVLLGSALPFMVVKMRRDKLLSKLESQLPEALELLARALRVGHPLNVSINTVAREMADPIATEFGVIFDQVSFGDDLPDAVDDFARRTGLEDAKYFSASVSIQYGTGGDLARICATLAKVIRDRIVLRRRIKSISAEGRLTAYFLSALPLAIFGLTSWSSPSYYIGVKDDPLFVPMIATIAALTLANALALRSLVNFRI